MPSNFSGHKDDRGDCSLHSIDFEFEWPSKPTFRDALDECFIGMSSYKQMTFAGEAGILSRDFSP